MLKGRIIKLFALFAAMIGLVGCDEYLVETLPLGFDGLAKSFYKDIPYDFDTRNKFDVLVPDACATPCPVAVYIHGGAFQSGYKGAAYEVIDDDGELAVDTDGDGSVDVFTISKESYEAKYRPVYQGQYDEKQADAWRYVNATKGLLDSGIAVATVNYRYLKRNGQEDVGLMKPLGDIKRAIQVLRLTGGDMDLDTSRMMLFGHSAGAGAALWLAFSDEMANPSGDDVEQQSTRVLGVYAFEAQATYDIVKWDDEVMPDSYIKSDLLGEEENLEGAKNVLMAAYALDNLDEHSDFYQRDVNSIREAVDMLGLMSADDPEFWVDNSEVQGTYQNLKTADAFYHGGEHAVALHNRALEVGVRHTAETYTGYLDKGNNSDANGIDFAKRILLP